MVSRLLIKRVKITVFVFVIPMLDAPQLKMIAREKDWIWLEI
jgi:hypothetical protein